MKDHYTKYDTGKTKRKKHHKNCSKDNALLFQDLRVECPDLYIFYNFTDDWIFVFLWKLCRWNI